MHTFLLPFYIDKFWHLAVISENDLGVIDEIILYITQISLTPGVKMILVISMHNALLYSGINYVSTVSRQYEFCRIHSCRLSPMYLYRAHLLKRLLQRET